MADGKKLLVLSVKGFLIDTYHYRETFPDRPRDTTIDKFFVYKRAGCDEFLQYCLDNFVVGVWSSVREYNLRPLVEYVFKNVRGKPAFIWHQTHCTDTNLRHPENKYKPLFLKELSKLWNKTEPDLPWEKGFFGPTNTVLIDETPYTALKNPPHTGIFPAKYKATCPEDNYLAGELRNYLKGLVDAANVQVYIEKHPIGMLDDGDVHYSLFSSVKDRSQIQKSRERQASLVQPPASPKQEEKVAASEAPASPGQPPASPKPEEKEAASEAPASPGQPPASLKPEEKVVASEAPPSPGQLPASPKPEEKVVASEVPASPKPEENVVAVANNVKLPLPDSDLCEALRRSSIH